MNVGELIGHLSEADPTTEVVLAMQPNDADPTAVSFVYADEEGVVVVGSRHLGDQP